MNRRGTSIGCTAGDDRPGEQRAQPGVADDAFHRGGPADQIRGEQYEDAHERARCRSQHMTDHDLPVREASDECRMDVGALPRIADGRPHEAGPERSRAERDGSAGDDEDRRPVHRGASGGHERHGRQPSERAGEDDDETGGDRQRIVLNSFQAGIAGGTDEIQRNIISERILGLPREPR